MTSTPVAGQRVGQLPLRAALQTTATLGRLADDQGALTRWHLEEVDGVMWRWWYPEGATAQVWQNTTTGELYAEQPDLINQAPMAAIEASITQEGGE